MEILRIDHIVLTVRSIEASVEFYVKTLGANVVDTAGRVALHFGNQKINLHVAGSERAPHAARPGIGTADYCIVTAAPRDEIEAHLANAEVEIELGPVSRDGALGRMTSFYFRDPDGNLVELSTYAG